MKNLDMDLTSSPIAKQPTSKPFVVTRLNPSEIESLRQEDVKAREIIRELIAKDKAAGRF